MTDVDAYGSENPLNFEQRKRDHIRWALDPRTQAEGAAGFARIELIHEALPELNFSEVNLATSVLGQLLPTPFLISSMTAGHGDALALNIRLAKAAAERGWLMGVGSQRRQLFDAQAQREAQELRQAVPEAKFLANIGLAQLIVSPVSAIASLVDSLRAEALIVHTNPLQEALQPEGTPNFRGGEAALRKFCQELKVPVILKETGCGVSRATLLRLKGSGIAAVDLSGFGGTHWGRIEGFRADNDDVRAGAAQAFRNWGLSTVDSLIAAMDVAADFEIWASGGVRSGLDAAKALALGAKVVGVAQPILVAALEGEEALRQTMSRFEFELRCAMFCTGAGRVVDLSRKRVWRWKST